MQIHYENWLDATGFDKTIGGKYSDCRDLNYSIKIFNAYIRKYADGKSTEVKARVVAPDAAAAVVVVEVVDCEAPDLYENKRGDST